MFVVIVNLYFVTIGYYGIECGAKERDGTVDGYIDKQVCCIWLMVFETGTKPVYCEGWMIWICG